MNDLISRQAAIDDILRRLDTLKMTEFGTGTFRDGVADGYARIISDLKSLPSAQPEPLTDTEQRIFLAAMGREEKVCKQVDEECCIEPYEDSLVRVYHEIIRKVKGALWTYGITDSF